MGKASSSKKVARAARTGGKVTGQRRNLGFPSAIVAIVVLGIGLVAFARNSTPGGGEPSLQDHWHAAFGIYLCDRWVQDLPDGPTDQLGIHTHEDGLIHVHPFLAGATGRSATLGKFFDQVGLQVSDSSITLPPGELYGERQYKNGVTKCGDETGRVVLAYWTDALTAADGAPDDVRTSNIASEHIDADGGAFTLAFLPKGEDIPPPPAAADIIARGAADGAPTQPVTGQPDETERGDEGDTSGETVPADTGSDAPEPSSEGTEGTEPSSETTAPASTEAPAGG